MAQWCTIMALSHVSTIIFSIGHLAGGYRVTRPSTRSNQISNVTIFNTSVQNINRILPTLCYPKAFLRKCYDILLTFLLLNLIDLITNSILMIFLFELQEPKLKNHVKETCSKRINLMVNGMEYLDNNTHKEWSKVTGHNIQLY